MPTLLCIGDLAHQHQQLSEQKQFFQILFKCLYRSELDQYSQKYFKLSWQSAKPAASYDSRIPCLFKLFKESKMLVSFQCLLDS